jgi:hypothetical protein
VNVEDMLGEVSEWNIFSIFSHGPEISRTEADNLTTWDSAHHYQPQPHGLLPFFFFFFSNLVIAHYPLQV